MNLGLKLKKIRKENNLSQKAIAEMLYISQGNYSLYESNRRNPSLDFLMRVIEKFSLDANWLFCEQNIDYYKIDQYQKESNDELFFQRLTEIEKKLDLILDKN